MEPQAASAVTCKVQRYGIRFQSLFDHIDVHSSNIQLFEIFDWDFSVLILLLLASFAGVCLLRNSWITSLAGIAWHVCDTASAAKFGLQFLVSAKSNGNLQEGHSSVVIYNPISPYLIWLYTELYIIYPPYTINIHKSLIDIPRA